MNKIMETILLVEDRFLYFFQLVCFLMIRKVTQPLNKYKDSLPEINIGTL